MLCVCVLDNEQEQISMACFQLHMSARNLTKCGKGPSLAM